MYTIVLLRMDSRCVQQLCADLFLRLTDRNATRVICIANFGLEPARLTTGSPVLFHRTHRNCSREPNKRRRKSLNGDHQALPRLSVKAVELPDSGGGDDGRRLAALPSPTLAAASECIH